ncbi:hypothetical protein NMY22_g14042 [Coprinellus aureogranulatus]|nr:hypothetical protein NMY22_g14042 [Coprinellus aureogranulatus]
MLHSTSSTRRPAPNQENDPPPPPPSDEENNPPPAPPRNKELEGSQSLGRRSRGSEDNLGPLIQPIPRLDIPYHSTRQDPLVHHGRHFGRSVNAFCRPFPLLSEGLSRQLQIQAGVLSLEELSKQEAREHAIFSALLKMAPGLEERVLKASGDELHYIADMFNKGSSCARADDTRSLKSVIVDWITPPGGALSPPLSRNVKTDRGFYHYVTGELLCPATLDWKDEETRKALRSGEITVSGDQWPVFLYRDHTFNPENPWDGLFEGKLLVSAFKHVFTSPSSVEQETRATRSGNAEIHGMKSVTLASIAYICTLVRFSLSSSAVFSRNDKSTDSERFYRSIMDFLESPSEHEEVDELIKWWNKRVFPTLYTDSGDPNSSRAVPSVMDKMKEWRASKRPSSSVSRNRPTATGGLANGRTP